MKGVDVSITVLNRYFTAADEEVFYSANLNFTGIFKIHKGYQTPVRGGTLVVTQDINIDRLRLTIPPLPGHLPSAIWDEREEKCGYFTLRRNDVIDLDGRRWIIVNVTDNTSRPQGKHFVIECVDEVNAVGFSMETET